MMEKLNKFLIPVAIVIAGLAIGGAILYTEIKNKSNIVILPAQQAAEKAISYINGNLLQQGTTASLVNVVEEDGIYKFKLKIQEQEYDSYVTKDGKLLFTQAINIEEKISTTTSDQNGVQSAGTTIGTFSISSDTICQEKGKPIIYFFGSASCPHCQWEKPIIESLAKKFEGYISFHENIDTENDIDIFSKYSTGGVPTLVLGCKYYRVGSGEQAGQDNEIKNLTALFCKLTGEKPGEACESVKDLINQIQ